MRRIKRLYRRYQSFVFSISLFTICVLVLLMGIFPALEKVKGLWTYVNELKVGAKLLSDKARQLDTLNEQVMSQQFRELVWAVPLDKSLSSIFLTTDALFSQSGLSVSSITIQSPGSIATGSANAQLTAKKLTGESKMKFSVSAKGSYDQVKSFLNSVHAIRRLLSLKEIDISFQKSEVVTVQLSFETYYRPLSGDVPTVDSLLPMLTSEDETMMRKISSYTWLAQSVVNMTSRINPQGKSDPFAP